MSVHTFRQRSALQRAQVRWRPRANHLRLVPATPARPTRLERLATRLWRLHDASWPWFIAAVLIAVADVVILASFLPGNHI